MCVCGGWGGEGVHRCMDVCDIMNYISLNLQATLSTLCMNSYAFSYPSFLPLFLPQLCVSLPEGWRLPLPSGQPLSEERLRSNCEQQIIHFKSWDILGSTVAQGSWEHMIHSSSGSDYFGLHSPQLRDRNTVAHRRRNTTTRHSMFTL